MTTLDTTRGPLAAQSMRLAMPAVMQAILVNCYAFNDFFFVGMLGDPSATAALSACFALVIVANTLLGVFPVGAMSLMARTFGAGDRARVAGIFRQAAIVASVWAGAIGVVGLIAMPWIVGATNVTPEVGERLATYMTVIFAGLPLFALMRLVTGTFYACGNTRLPLGMEILSLVVNTALNYVLVLGAGPIPGMGIFGAGVATLVSRTLPGVLGFVLLWRGALGFEIRASWARWRPVRADTQEMGRIGMYESIAGVLYGVVYLMLNRIAGQIGPAAQGGLGAGLRGIEWIAFAFGDGFMKATVAIVGQNLGAGEHERAMRGAWLNAGMSALFSQLVGMLFLIFPRELSAIVTDDPATLDFAAAYVNVIGWVMWAVGLEMAMYGAMIGAGRTSIVLWVSGSCNLLRVPLAAALVFGAPAMWQGVVWVVTGVGDAPALVGGFDGLSYTIAGTAVLKALIYGTFFTLRPTIERP